MTDESAAPPGEEDASPMTETTDEAPRIRKGEPMCHTCTAQAPSFEPIAKLGGEGILAWLFWCRNCGSLGIGPHPAVRPWNPHSIEPPVMTSRALALSPQELADAANRTLIPIA